MNPPATDAGKNAHSMRFYLHQSVTTLNLKGPAMPKTPKYGSYDGYAVRFVDDEAWALADDGTWHEMNPADAVFEAALLSEQAYLRRNLPPLPSAAFSGDPWQRAKRRTRSDQRMLDDDAKQGGGHAQHMIARRTAPNGPEPDPARYAAALARAREIYGRVLDSYSAEWKAALGIGDTGISGVGSDSGPNARPAAAGVRMPGKPKASGGWSSPLV